MELALESTMDSILTRKYFEIKEDGWKHDHCELCYTRISEGEYNTRFEIEGFNTDNKWICNECFKKHMETK